MDALEKAALAAGRYHPCGTNFALATSDCYGVRTGKNVTSLMAGLGVSRVTVYAWFNH